jgi:DNA-binding transcriptional regulator YiaG/transposase
MMLSRNDLYELKLQHKSNREIAAIFKISEAFVSFLIKKYEIVIPGEQVPPPPIPVSTPIIVAPTTVSSDVKSSEKSITESVRQVNRLKPEAVEPIAPVAVLIAKRRMKIQLTREEFIKLQEEFHTDKKLAEKLAVSTGTVIQMRKRYNIPSNRVHAANSLGIDRDKLIELQKTYKTDKSIADTLGIKQLHVFQLRKKFSVPALRRSAEIDISEEQFVELHKELGKDSEIAKRLNISVFKIPALRKKFGIVSNWRDKKSVEKYTLTREELVNLQQEHKSDKKIAETIGKSLSYVFAMRKHFGIPIYHKSENETILTDNGSNGQRVNFNFNKLVDIRKDHKLKQYEFAKKIGISDAHLRKFEHGMKYPRIYILLKLLNEFKINPNYLFLEETGEMYLPTTEMANASGNANIPVV